MENWRERKPRKRGFDDESSSAGGGWESRPLPFPAANAGRPVSGAASGGDTTATVKWYNTEKGFGFVEVAGGIGDAFLHASVLQRISVSEVNPGDVLKARIGPGQKGLQVTDVMSVEPGTATAPARSPVRGATEQRGYTSAGAAVEMRGTVKWYNATKGFGFISPEDGSKDIFVHATALQRSNLADLADGQQVVMQVVEGKKGPEANTLRL